MQQPIPLTKATDIEISNGTSLLAAVNILKKYNAISHPTLFSWMLKIYSSTANKGIVAGYYRFSPEISHLKLMSSLCAGKQTVTVNVVYPEGIPLKEFASISARQIGLDSAEFMRLATSDSLLQSRNISGKSVEGYLMPDTYNFFWKQSPASVINRLLDAQEKMWNTYSEEAAKQNKTRKEILTMASIIEAETPLTEEKKDVAGLYYNRLKKNMKLEADPTVQYALNNQKRLTYKDLEFDSRYNTYRFAGLPPGPINSPGKASVEAAIYPENNDYLFFVAKGDGTGSHTFSKNYADHQKAVQLYRKRRNNK